MDRRFRTGSLVVLLSMLTLAIGFTSRPVKLRAATGQELARTVGGACESTESDATYCTFATACLQPPDETNYTRTTSTNAVKRWCGGTTGVCDCNQDGVPQTDCTTTATCTGRDANGDCTGCGADTPATTVQTTVNENGATCTKDADCDG